VAWNICKQAPGSPACVSKENESLSFVEKKNLILQKQLKPNLKLLEYESQTKRLINEYVWVFIS